MCVSSLFANATTLITLVMAEAIWLRSQKYLLSGPLQEKLFNPWFRWFLSHSLPICPQIGGFSLTLSFCFILFYYEFLCFWFYIQIKWYIRYFHFSESITTEITSVIVLLHNNIDLTSTFKKQRKSAVCLSQSCTKWNILTERHRGKKNNTITSVIACETY